MTKQLINKKYKIGVKEDAFAKSDKPKEYKGMDTGRGYIKLETTNKKPWNIKDKLLTRIKKYFNDVRLNR